jgi:hypothetical protein
MRKLCLVCGHDKNKHEHRTPEVPALDNICWKCDDGCFDKYHTFQLDNLQLIEDLAKQRKLI